MPTAILVDGAFFLRRFSKCFPDCNSKDPKSVAHGLGLLAYMHIAHRIGGERLTKQIKEENFQVAESNELYRIFFYDCAPFEKRMHQPISKKSIDFSKTEEAIFRKSVHIEILKLRKIALRLGRLNDTSKWRLSEAATDRFLKEGPAFVAKDEDFAIDIKQKGVDMRLGLDVASLAFKKQVDQIVLVASDADFVPAAKLARREGIDVVLDRMGDTRAAVDLLEHVDGVRDCFLPSPKEL